MILRGTVLYRSIIKASSIEITPTRDTMRFFVLSYVIVLFLSLSSIVAALTNAQRLARGLPVLPSPKFRRALPGYAWTSTVAGAQQSASPTPSPSNKIAGRILAVSYDGKPLGNLYNWFSGINGINFGTPSSDLYVSFTMPQSEQGLIDVLAINAAFPAPYYIGSTSNGTLAPDSPTVVGFGNVIRTPVRSPPIPVGQQQADESAIWTFNTTNRELQVHYINPNGHTANTIIAYNIQDNSIFFVGDIGTYNAAQVDPNLLVSPITFFLDV